MLKVGAPNHCGGANWIFSDSTSGGRDAAEVAFCSPFGEMEAEKPEVSITGPADAEPSTVKAVRTQAA